jgi:hypothetical protein
MAATLPHKQANPISSIIHADVAPKSFRSLQDFWSLFLEECPS